jgi:hypothetical protein
MGRISVANRVALLLPFVLAALPVAGQEKRPDAAPPGSESYRVKQQQERAVHLVKELQRADVYAASRNIAHMSTSLSDSEYARVEDLQDAFDAATSMNEHLSSLVLVYSLMRDPHYQNVAFVIAHTTALDVLKKLNVGIARVNTQLIGVTTPAVLAEAQKLRDYLEVLRDLTMRLFPTKESRH